MISPLRCQSLLVLFSSISLILILTKSLVVITPLLFRPFPFSSVTWI